MKGNKFGQTRIFDIKPLKSNIIKYIKRKFQKLSNINFKQINL